MDFQVKGNSFMMACLLTAAVRKRENAARINEGSNATQNQVSVLPLKPISFWMRGNKSLQQGTEVFTHREKCECKI